MSFVSFSFLVLLGVVLALRLTIGRAGREPSYLFALLIASLVFYGWHVPAYLGLLALSAGVDYLAARRIRELPAGAPLRKRLLIVSLCVNLGLLALFKYADFAAVALEDLAAWTGIDLELRRLGWVLPIGISFYTFQSMSYTIDVYRGVLEPSRNFRRFLLFVGFFPQLVAGPIVRAKEFFYQLDRPRPPRLRVWGEGVFLIVQGFFLKMVLADNLAPVVDYMWPTVSKPGADAATSFAVVVLFSCQIFCDFAGYSRIARGTAYLLGFRLPVNFRSPYIAASFKEFWTRWHISLSSWLRDYLYISLGGNRISPRRTYVNLMLVMLLGGLWHGAAWTFVAWGGLHGVALAIERFAGRERAGEQGSWIGRLVGVFVVQLVVLATWVFFRAQSFGEAMGVFANCASLRFALPETDVLLGLGFCLPVMIMHLRAALEERGLVAPFDGRDQALWTGALLYLIIACYGSSNAFIYFQF